MGTTLATLAGLQEQIISDSTALFRTNSDLFSAVYTESAGSANTVNFSVTSVPAAAVKQDTELTDVSPTAVTIGRVPAALETVPILARVSKISLAAPNASMKIAQALAGGIARAIDTSITTLASGFSVASGVSTAALTLEALFLAAAKLDATGFVGQKVAILHPVAFANISKDLFSVANSKLEEFLSRGYITTLGGLQIYVSPWVTSQTVSTDLQANNMIMFKEAVGLGYREPIIDIDSAMNLEKVGVDVLATSFFKTLELTDGCGIHLKSKIG